MINLITPFDFHEEIATRMVSKIVKYTPQIFTVKDPNNKFSLFADSSSVLLTVKERFFLITSGHTVQGIGILSIGIMIGRDFFSIGGTLSEFDSNDSENYEPNKFDIAIFELNNDTVCKIKEEYDFLPWNKVGTNHSSSERERYLLFGYPEEGTKKDFPTRKISSVPFILRTVGVSKEQYLKEDINSKNVLILDAEQKYIKWNRGISNELRSLSGLGGISGCGVWGVSIPYVGDADFRLVSILTGENVKQTILFSTKMNIVKSILENRFNLQLD